MATITQFALDSNWDLDPAVVLTDLDAVSQIIAQRLRLLLGEWWEAQNQGLPLWQSILSAGNQGRNPQQASLLIQQCIEGSPYVNSITNLQVSFNAKARVFSFYCVAETQFGPLVVSNIPTPASQGLPA